MNGNKPYAFIFDMDGTLVDNMSVHNQVWLEMLAELGQQPDPETFSTLTAGRTNPEIFRMYLGQSASDEQVRQYSIEKEERYRRLYHNRVAPLPGSVDFLQKAQQAGILLALATSAGIENVRMVMDGTGLRDFFQVIINGDMIERGKPDPEIFLKSAGQLGVSPSRCLVFEDSPGGITAAQRAGMPVVVITTALSQDAALDLPGVKVASADFTSLDPQALLRFMI